MTTSKPFPVTFSYVAIVMADNQAHAEVVARATQQDILKDLRDKDIGVSCGNAIPDESSLAAHGYDGTCLPYGGNGDATLREIIAGLSAAPAQDTKTIDMFESLESAPDSSTPRR